MILIGVDFHPSVQQVAYVDTETGETCERRLNHSDGEAERFYRDLERRQVRVRVGIEATGHARWFERVAGRVEVRAMDWGRGQDQGGPGTQAEDRSAGCTAFTQA